jgi:plastocyanin
MDMYKHFLKRLAVLSSVSILLALHLTAVTTAAAAPKAVTGTVGPGFTIGLTLAGKKVTTLKAGVPYRFTIRDRSSIHDFHLRGPSVNRVLTGIDFTGTKTVVLRLKKGTYRFMCDPHAAFMHGSFRAVAAS